MCPAEQDFYPEICEKIEKYMREGIPDGYVCASSYNKSLSQMIEELKNKLSGQTDFDNNYIPNLKLDIMVGIKPPSGNIRLVLIEVKYLDGLQLINYSQLVGYLQVAKKISIGLLFLVIKKPGVSNLSNDFAEIINMKYLPMDYTMCVREPGGEETYGYRVGICSMNPKSGIEWIPTSACFGISGWEVLSEIIKHEN